MSDTCANCRCILSREAKELPTFVPDGEGTDGEHAKQESFCPQCFVYVRAPLSPERFGLPTAGKTSILGWNMAAVMCSKCGFKTASIGHGAACGYCRSPHVVVLPPKDPKAAALMPTLSAPGPRSRRAARTS